MRTKGSFNKPKFAMVRLGDLTKVVNENLEVPVKISFLQELGLVSLERNKNRNTSHNATNDNANTSSPPVSSLQFNVIQ